MKEKSVSDAIRMPWLGRSCPSCHLKGGLRKVIWGLPEGEPDQAIYETGGCLPEKHNYVCVNCNWKGVRIPKQIRYLPRKNKR